MNQFERTKQIVRQLHESGVKPTPHNVHRRYFGREPRRGRSRRLGPCLNSVMAGARAEALRELGWYKQHGNDRWLPPEGWPRNVLDGHAPRIPPRRRLGEE